MITRLKLALEQVEYSALLKSAMADLRNPADQARFILLRELERRGLLEALATPPTNAPAPALESKGVPDDAR